MAIFLFLPPTMSPGVKTEEIRKGRILAGLTDIWRVFLEIRPLQKSKEKPRKNLRKTNKKLRTTKKTHIFLLFFDVFLCFDPRSPLYTQSLLLVS